MPCNCTGGRYAVAMPGCAIFRSGTVDTLIVEAASMLALAGYNLPAAMTVVPLFRSQSDGCTWSSDPAWTHGVLTVTASRSGKEAPEAVMSYTKAGTSGVSLAFCRNFDPLSSSEFSYNSSVSTHPDNATAVNLPFSTTESFCVRPSACGHVKRVVPTVSSQSGVEAEEVENECDGPEFTPRATMIVNSGGTQSTPAGHVGYTECDCGDGWYEWHDSAGHYNGVEILDTSHCRGAFLLGLPGQSTDVRYSPGQPLVRASSCGPAPCGYANWLRVNGAWKLTTHTCDAPGGGAFVQPPPGAATDGDVWRTACACVKNALWKRVDGAWVLVRDNCAHDSVPYGRPQEPDYSAADGDEVTELCQVRCGTATFTYIVGSGSTPSRWITSASSCIDGGGATPAPPTSPAANGAKVDRACQCSRCGTIVWESDGTTWTYVSDNCEQSITERPHPPTWTGEPGQRIQSPCPCADTGYATFVWDDQGRWAPDGRLNLCHRYAALPDPPTTPGTRVGQTVTLPCIACRCGSRAFIWTSGAYAAYEESDCTPSGVEPAAPTLPPFPRSGVVRIPCECQE